MNILHEFDIILWLCLYSVNDVTSPDGGISDVGPSDDCPTSSVSTTDRCSTLPDPAPVDSSSLIEHDETGRDDDSELTVEYEEDCSERRYSHVALILKLQNDMATMQLQLSNLQDAMRTANTTLQQLLSSAFNDTNR